MKQLGTQQFWKHLATQVLDLPRQLAARVLPQFKEPFLDEQVQFKTKSVVPPSQTSSRSDSTSPAWSALEQAIRSTFRAPQVIILLPLPELHETLLVDALHCSNDSCRQTAGRRHLDAYPKLLSNGNWGDLAARN